jgi:F420-dependent oxidoreductase-like protein
MIDISLWAGADARTVATVIERVQAAADEGFGGIWLAQTPTVDAIGALTVAGHVVPDIKIGTAVVPIQGRHPIPLAQQALTAADAAGPGRFTLGVGVTHAMVSEGWFGIPYRSVVPLCRDEMEVLSKLLSAERKADFSSERLTARITLGMDVAAPGLLLAALGPQMLDIAGRYADGTVTWMTGRRTIGTRVAPALREAAERAGRPAPRVAVGLHVCVTDDPSGARERLTPAMSGAAQMPSYKRMVAEEGVDRPADIALVGDEDRVRELIDELEAAGATELIANVAGSPEEQARTRSFLPGL